MKDNKLSLIDTNGLGQVGIALLDKLSDAVGWIVNHDTPKRIANKVFVDDIQNSNLSPFEKHVLLNNMNKLTREYSNQQNVVKIALDHLNEQAQPHKVDVMFIAQLMDKARFASTEQFQLIWGKILAEECNNPDSIPKSLLFTLEQMDKYDAESFVELCSCSIVLSSEKEKCFSPVVLFHSTPKDMYISFDSITRIESLGLIKSDLGPFRSGFSEILSMSPIQANYFADRFIFPKGMCEIPIGNVILTPKGKALSKIVTPNEIPEFFAKECIPFFNQSIKEYSEKNKKQTL